MAQADVRSTAGRSPARSPRRSARARQDVAERRLIEAERRGEARRRPHPSRAPPSLHIVRDVLEIGPRQHAAAAVAVEDDRGRISSSFARTARAIGKAISDSSLIGVPSCFSGGRRMVKWTRSTDGSDFSMLRQVRSPACGSPETSSTRRRSRTPLTTATARVVDEAQLARSPGSTCELDQRRPPGSMSRWTRDLRSTPMGRSTRCLGWPSWSMIVDLGSAPIGARRAGRRCARSW